MSVYTPAYGPVYGAGGFPLDIQTDLLLGGDWTSVTEWTYNRSTPAFTITRGRQDETSQVSPSSMAGQLNNRDGRFTVRNPAGPYYGQLNRNTPVRLSVPDGSTTLRFADDNQSYISCPDATPLQLTGNIDARVDLDLDDYQACTLAGKWGGSTVTWAWCLVLNGDGTITWWWYDGVTANSAQSTLPVPLGRVMIRCFFDASAGTVYFYTAPDMGGSQTQLGAAVAITAADYAQGAAGQPVQVGYVDGFIGQGLPAGNSGLLGKVYEFALYNASAALVADPQFYAQSPGATSFADGQGNTWTADGTAELSARSYRYHGEMSSLPVAWDVSGRDIWVPFTAGGILRRLQQGNSPVLSAMRRGITSDIAVNWGVSCYWPCEDGAGATRIASGLPGGSPMTFTGGPTFQAQPGSPSADSIFACSAQLPQVNSSAWTGTIPAYSTAGIVGLYLLLAIPSGGIPDGTELLIMGGPGGYLVLEYAAAANGTLSLDVGGVGSTAGPTGVNGQALWVELASSASESSLNVLPAGETAGTSYTIAGGSAGPYTQVKPNWLSGNCGATEIGHIFFSPDPPPLDAYAQLLAAWAGETAGNRFARACGENSVPARVYGAPDNSAAMGVQPVDTLMNILQSCEDADRGMIFEPAGSYGVGYRTLASLCNQVPAVTLDYSAAEVGDQEKSPVSLTSVDDDQYTRNDWTLTRTSGSVSGASYQAQLDDGSPMSIRPPAEGGAGDYANTLSVNVESDGQLPGNAWWMVHVGTCADARYPQMVTGLHRLPVIEAGLGYVIQDVRTGDFARIINQLAQLPPGDIKQIAAGATEQLSRTLYQVSWNAVPESPYEVAVADVSLAESSGTTLAAGYSPTAASFSVDVTGTLWATGAVSFNVMIGGEEIGVTNISGASSPQTFTVVRSVNGVVKSQASGAAVALAAEPVAALAA